LGNPVEQVSIRAGPNWFEKVQRQTVAIGSVKVENSKTRIETKGGSREPSFGLQDGMEVIQDRVRRFDGKSRGAGQRRDAGSETAPTIGHSATLFQALGGGCRNEKQASGVINASHSSRLP
jgi:hypothetical protein